MPHTLPLSEVKTAVALEGKIIEAWLTGCLHGGALPPGLRSAMEYSLLAGGKRLRPILCVVSARLFGLEGETALPFAAAIECIHTYSLIHDDLPAMDNDDLRRGKPSNHKQFDEATAILAGDALLTDAFSFMAGVQEIPAQRVLRALALVAEAAGSGGMVGGQFLDMHYTGAALQGKTITLEQLAAMHAMKTGALLRCPCEAGAVLAGAPEEAVQAMRQYGTSLGAAFQITDDILDETGTEETLGKPVGSDKDMGKTTYPSLLGLEHSKRLATEHAAAATQALAPFTGPEAALLRGLAEYVINRVS